MALCKNCFIHETKRTNLCKSCTDSGIIKPTKPTKCVSCKERKPISIGRCSKCYQYYRSHGADRVPGQARYTRSAGPKCIICGIPNIVSKERCSACYQYFTKHGTDIDSQTARKRARKRMKKTMVCVACARPQVISKDRCGSCYQYFLKYKKDRTADEIKLIRDGRVKHKKCLVCGIPKVATKGRCVTCYQYYNRHGKDRTPKEIKRLLEWRKPHKRCSVCRSPKVVTKGRCAACYQHYNKHGKDRTPEEIRSLLQWRKPNKKCTICGIPKVAIKDRCSTCYQHLLKHGQDRTPEELERLLEWRKPHKRCSVCRSPKVATKGRCGACYQHYAKHGQDRTPEEVEALLQWRNPDKKCLVCGRPKVASKGRCSSCYQYYAKNKEDRSPERLQQLLNRSGPRQPCSNCKVRPASTKGRCPSCYQYFNLRGVDRDPERIRNKTPVERRPAKQSCINGCTLEPKLWADTLWIKPHYGSKPKITTMIKRKEKEIDSAWLCTVHHDRWKKYPCVQKRAGNKDMAPVYAKGPWVCKGPALSGSDSCPNLPAKLPRTSTGELDHGSSEPDELAIFFDGLCHGCRSADQDMLYEQAAEMYHVGTPSQEQMTEALHHIQNGTRPVIVEPEPEKILSDADVLKWSQDKARVFQREDVMSIILYDYNRWGPDTPEEELRERFGQMIEEAKESDAQQPGNKIEEWSMHMDDRAILMPLLKVGKRVSLMEEMSGRTVGIVDAALDEMKRWGKYAGIEQYERELGKLLPEFETSYEEEDDAVGESMVDESEEAPLTMSTVQGEWGPTMDDYE